MGTLLQQLARESLGGGLRITPALHENVEHDPVLIDGAPEPVCYTGNLDDDLIPVPLVARTRQPAPDLIGRRLAELQRH